MLRPWDGHVVLMRAEKGGFEADGLGAAYGWDEMVTGGVDVVEVPGDHDTLVLEPNATTLVQELRSTLDRTQAGRADRRTADRRTTDRRTTDRRPRTADRGPPDRDHRTADRRTADRRTADR